MAFTSLPIISVRTLRAPVKYSLLTYNGTIVSNFQNITSQLFPTSVGGFTLNHPSSLGEDAIGELYITDIGNGSVFKIVASAVKSDFNADIIWQNTSTGQRLIWIMNGTTLQYAVNLPTEPTYWSIAGTGDFNRDSNADIIWQNTVTGQRLIWIMNGTTLAVWCELADGARHPGASLVRVTLTGTATPDIIWQNTSTGQRTNLDHEWHHASIRCELANGADILEHRWYGRL